jgi:hypothetical protein
MDLHGRRCRLDGRRNRHLRRHRHKGSHRRRRWGRHGRCGGRARAKRLVKVDVKCSLRGGRVHTLLYSTRCSWRHWCHRRRWRTQIADAPVSIHPTGSGTGTQGQCIPPTHVHILPCRAATPPAGGGRWPAERQPRTGQAVHGGGLGHAGGRGRDDRGHRSHGRRRRRRRCGAHGRIALLQPPRKLVISLLLPLPLLQRLLPLLLLHCAHHLFISATPTPMHRERERERTAKHKNTLCLSALFSV